MPRTRVDDLTTVVKDAAYVTVGFGVLAFQRLQVRRKEVSKAYNGQTKDPKGPLEVLGAAVGERVKLVEERVSATLNR
ncbi:MAG: hypothetical protein ABWZ76_09035 [Acidimicrobiales bacterium]